MTAFKVGDRVRLGDHEGIITAAEGEFVNVDLAGSGEVWGLPDDMLTLVAPPPDPVRVLSGSGTECIASSDRGYPVLTIGGGLIVSFLPGVARTLAVGLAAHADYADIHGGTR